MTDERRPREFWITKETFTVKWVDKRAGKNIVHGALEEHPMSILESEDKYIHVREVMDIDGQKFGEDAWNELEKKLAEMRALAGRLVEALKKADGLLCTYNIRGGVELPRVLVDLAHIEEALADAKKLGVE